MPVPGTQAAVKAAKPAAQQPAKTPPPPLSNEQFEWDYFIGQGFSPAQAAGILGNLQQESGFNPESVQQGGPGRGLAQWSQGGRWQPQDMTGNVQQDMTNQLNFIMQELQSNPGYGLAQLMQATTPEQAAGIFSQDYERPGVVGGRIQDAANIYAQATGQNSGFAMNPSQATQALPGGLSGQAALNAGAAGQLAPIGAGAATQYAGLGLQQGAAAGQQQVTDTQLYQQLQNTLANLGLSEESLGIQRTGLGEQQKYQSGEYALSQQDIQQALANLKTEYGLQGQQLGLERLQAGQQFGQSMQQAESGLAGSGVYNTGTRGMTETPIQQQYANTLAGLGIQQQQEAQAYKYGVQQEQQQAKSGALTNTYQQQQIQNALANLGISQQQLGLQGQYAQQEYSTGIQGAANAYEAQLAQMMQQAGQIQSSTAAQASQLYQGALNAFGGYGVG